MYPNKLYFKTALKLLENPKTRLVQYEYWNADIRDYDGDELGVISQKVTDKLINSGKLEFIGNGTGLLNHERYFKLKVAPAVL